MAKKKPPITTTAPRWLCKACLDGHHYNPRETRARFGRTCAHCGDKNETVFLVRTTCPTCFAFVDLTNGGIERALRGWETRRRNESSARRRAGNYG